MKTKSWDVRVLDNPNVMITTEADDFYTTDTGAFLVFELKDNNFNPHSALLTLTNQQDGSVVSETVPVNDKIIRYEMREEVIEHAGTWLAQLVYTQDKEGAPKNYTSKIISFSVSGHLMDKKEPALVAIENWNSFILHAGDLIEDWEYLESVRQANESTRIANESERQETFENNETARQSAENAREETFATNETDRQSTFETNENARQETFENNESERQTNYNELVDTGIMQENINQKLSESEQTYAPRLTNLEQNDATFTAQLAHTEEQLPQTVTSSVYTTAGYEFTAKVADAPLTIPTYEGSGQVVHPSVIEIPQGFGGFRYWMAMTPYPNGNDGYENPSVVASHDGIEWVVPEGLTNPIMDKPSGSYSFNSDPVLVYAEGKLHLFSRSVDRKFPGAEERIVYMVSDDGVNWTTPVAVLTHPLTDSVVSPAVVKAGGVWYMWGNKSSTKPNRLIRWKASTPNGPWIEPTICIGYNSKTPDGLDLWHMDIKFVNGEYVMLAHESTNGSGIVGGQLRRSVSKDGVVWVPDRLQVINMIKNTWGRSAYKSSFVPVTVNGKDAYRVWYGGVKDYSTYLVGHTLMNLYEKESMIPALVGADGYVAGDTFNRLDSSNIGTMSTGQEWITSPGGEVQIKDGELYHTSSSTSFFTIPGSLDVEIEATLTRPPADENSEFYLIVRSTLPSSNNISSRIRFGVDSFSQWRMDGLNRYESIGRESSTMTVTAGDVVRLSFEDGVAKGYVNDILLLEQFYSDIRDSTQLGLWMRGVVGIKDFKVRRL